MDGQKKEMKKISEDMNWNMERMKFKIQDLPLSLREHNEMLGSQSSFTKTEKIL